MAHFEFLILNATMVQNYSIKTIKLELCHEKLKFVQQYVHLVTSDFLFYICNISSQQ